MPVPVRNPSPPPGTTTPPPEYQESGSYLRGIPVLFFPVGSPIWIAPGNSFDSDSDSEGFPELQPVDDNRFYDGPSTDNSTEAQPTAAAQFEDASAGENSSDDQNPDPNDSTEDSRNMEWLVRLARAARALTRSSVARGERIIFDYTDTTLQVVYDATRRATANGEAADGEWMSEYFVDGNERDPPAHYRYERPVHGPQDAHRAWFAQPMDENRQQVGEAVETQWHEVLRLLCITSERESVNAESISPDVQAQ
ncbi:hypothetical protein V5O48_010188 [Marasmius crinis-equi]|uniref:Uncharacterized protein n=1 Tax=Marasmius crinis-equi TaxID=585013 RepID=A0ABR3F9H9_9AGAR